jgi:hypothetical protein
MAIAAAPTRRSPRAKPAAEPVMEVLAESVFWELEISFYLRAVEHGVEPVRSSGLGSVPFDPADPLYWACYSPHTFAFKHPPSREAFWALASQTPWMHHFRQDYKAIVDAGDWPMIDCCLKSAHVYLRNSQGRQVGEIEVRRRTIYLNWPYMTSPIWRSDIDAVCGRIHRHDLVSPAAQAVKAAEHKLKERLSHLDRAVSNADVRQVTRKYLKEIGIAPRSRRHRQPQIA